MTKATADGPRSAEAAYDEDTIEFQLGSELVEALSRAAETGRELHAASRAEPGASTGVSYEPAVPVHGYEHAANEHAADDDPTTQELSKRHLIGSALETAPGVAEHARQDSDEPTATSSLKIGKKSRVLTWLLVAAGLALVLTAGVALLQWPSAPHTEPLPPPPPAAIETPAVPAPEQTPQAELPTLPPVRYRNPFDRSEVFEFPAGTSVADAQQAVADMLLQRAQERRAARLIKHHRAAIRSAEEDTSLAQNSASRRGR